MRGEMEVSLPFPSAGEGRASQAERSSQSARESRARAGPSRRGRETVGWVTRRAGLGGVAGRGARRARNALRPGSLAPREK